MAQEAVKRMVARDIQPMLDAHDPGTPPPKEVTRVQWHRRDPENRLHVKVACGAGMGSKQKFGILMRQLEHLVDDLLVQIGTGEGHVPENEGVVLLGLRVIDAGRQGLQRVILLGIKNLRALLVGEVEIDHIVGCSDIDERRPGLPADPGKGVDKTVAHLTGHIGPVRIGDAARCDPEHAQNVAPDHVHSPDCRAKADATPFPVLDGGNAGAGKCTHDVEAGIHRENGALLLIGPIREVTDLTPGFISGDDVVHGNFKIASLEQLKVLGLTDRCLNVVVHARNIGAPQLRERAAPKVLNPVCLARRNAESLLGIGSTGSTDRKTRDQYRKLEIVHGVLPYQAGSCSIRPNS